MVVEKNIKHDPGILKSLLSAFDVSNIDDLVRNIIHRVNDFDDLNEENLSDIISQRRELNYVIKAYKRALKNINEYY